MTLPEIVRHVEGWHEDRVAEMRLIDGLPAKTLEERALERMAAGGRADA